MAEPHSVDDAPGSGQAVDNRRARGVSPRAAVAVLAVLVVVLAAAVVWEMVQTLKADAADAAGQDAQSAARAAAQAIMSYDYRTLDSDMAAARSMTTGSFRRQYEADAPRLLEIARQYKGITRADVWAAGTQSQSPGQVTVILFVDQTTTQASDKTPRLSENRVEMTMRKVGGNWLVAGMQAL
jgi:Mce-associated membrane protein